MRMRRVQLTESGRYRLLKVLMEKLGINMPSIWAMGPFTMVNEEGQTMFDSELFAEAWVRAAKACPQLPIAWIGQYGKAGYGLHFATRVRGKVVNAIEALWPGKEWAVAEMPYLQLLLSTLEEYEEVDPSNITILSGEWDTDVVLMVYDYVVHNHLLRHEPEAACDRTRALVHRKLKEVSKDGKVTLAALADALWDGAHPQGAPCRVTQERIAIMREGGLTLAKGVVFYDALIARFLDELGVVLPADGMALMPNSVKIKTDGSALWAIRGVHRVPTCERRVDGKHTRIHQQMVRWMRPDIQQLMFEQSGWKAYLTDLLAAVRAGILSRALKVMGVSEESVGDVTMAGPGILRTELGPVAASAFIRKVRSAAHSYPMEGASFMLVPDIGIPVKAEGADGMITPMSVPERGGFTRDSMYLLVRAPVLTPGSVAPAMPSRKRRDNGLGLHPLTVWCNLDGDFDGDSVSVMEASCFTSEVIGYLAHTADKVVEARFEAEIPPMVKRRGPASLPAVTDVADQVIETAIGKCDTALAAGWEAVRASGRRVSLKNTLSVAHTVISAIDMSKKRMDGVKFLTMEMVRGIIAAWAGARLPKVTWNAVRKSGIRGHMGSLAKLPTGTLAHACEWDWSAVAKKSLFYNGTNPKRLRQREEQRSAIVSRAAEIAWAWEPIAAASPSTETLAGTLAAMYDGLDLRTVAHNRGLKGRLFFHAHGILASHIDVNKEVYPRVKRFIDKYVAIMNRSGLPDGATQDDVNAALDELLSKPRSVAFYIGLVAYASSYQGGVERVPGRYVNYLDLLILCVPRLAWQCISLSVSTGTPVPRHVLARKCGGDAVCAHSQSTCTDAVTICKDDIKVAPAGPPEVIGVVHLDGQAVVVTGVMIAAVDTINTDRVLTGNVADNVAHLMVPGRAVKVDPATGKTSDGWLVDVSLVKRAMLMVSRRRKLQFETRATSTRNVNILQLLIDGKVVCGVAGVS